MLSVVQIQYQKLKVPPLPGTVNCCEKKLSPGFSLPGKPQKPFAESPANAEKVPLWESALVTTGVFSPPVTQLGAKAPVSNPPFWITPLLQGLGVAVAVAVAVSLAVTVA